MLLSFTDEVLILGWYGWNLQFVALSFLTWFRDLFFLDDNLNLRWQSAIKSRESHSKCGFYFRIRLRWRSKSCLKWLLVCLWCLRWFINARLWQACIIGLYLESPVHISLGMSCGNQLCMLNVWFSVIPEATCRYNTLVWRLIDVTLGLTGPRDCLSDFIESRRGTFQSVARILVCAAAVQRDVSMVLALI